jgi:hypothetical protein
LSPVLGIGAFAEKTLVAAGQCNARLFKGSAATRNEPSGSACARVRLQAQV